jgi:phage gp46-like protein
MIKPLAEPSEEEINKAIEEENQRLNDAGQKKMDGPAKDKFRDNYRKQNTFQLWENTFGEGGYGMYSIPFVKGKEAFDYATAANSGVIESDFGMTSSKKYVAEGDQGTVNTALLLKMFTNMRVLPTEAGYAADKMMKSVEKKSLTGAQKSHQDNAIAFLAKEGTTEITQDEIARIRDKGMTAFEAIVDSRMTSAAANIETIKKMVMIKELSNKSGLPVEDVLSRVKDKDVTNASILDLFRDDIENFQRAKTEFAALKKKAETSELSEIKKMVR